MKRTYVPGTYIEIPAKLLRYRSKFKQVGKIVFITVDGSHMIAEIVETLTGSAAATLAIGSTTKYLQRRVHFKPMRNAALAFEQVCRLLSLRA